MRHGGGPAYSSNAVHSDNSNVCGMVGAWWHGRGKSNFDIVGGVANMARVYYVWHCVPMVASA